MSIFLRMKKNSLELKKRQHAMLIEQERKEREKRERRQAARAEKEKEAEEMGEVEMRKEKFQRRVLPRREYKAQRRQAKLAKYAPRILSSDAGDIDMGDVSKPKNVTPVSKTLRLVKDKASIRKH